MYSFLQLLWNTEKISLNWRLDSTLTDYLLPIFIMAPLWYIMSHLKNVFIRLKIQKTKSCSLIEYCFFFWRKSSLFDWAYWRITQTGVLKWSEHQIKTHLCLEISELCRMNNFIGQSQNKNQMTPNYKTYLRKLIKDMPIQT